MEKIFTDYGVRLYPVYCRTGPSYIELPHHMSRLASALAPPTPTTPTKFPTCDSSEFPALDYIEDKKEKKKPTFKMGGKKKKGILKTELPAWTEMVQPRVESTNTNDIHNIDLC